MRKVVIWVVIVFVLTIILVTIVIAYENYKNTDDGGG